MSEECVDQEAIETSLWVRQPIFSRDKDVWGYEIVSNSPPVLANGIQPTTFADLVSVCRESMPALDAQLSCGKRFMVNTGDNLDLAHPQLPDRCDQCIVGISNAAADSPSCEEFAMGVREKGGVLVLDEGVDASSMEGLIDKCDILRVSLKGKTPPEIVHSRKKYKDLGMELMATDVDTWEAFEGTRALGFSYFQGAFFAIPQVKSDAPLAVNAVAKLQLLRELSNPVCEMEELAAIIASDVSLSYRILKYINSASFGLKNKIKSIQQAVSLLGLKEVRHWATVVVMTDLDSSSKGEELSYMALQRARFLSRMVIGLKGVSLAPNTMFMLGLFSMLDALLAMPMEDALADIPLDEDMKSALCGTLNEYRDWLRMIEAVEIGNWCIANDVLNQYGACFTQAATQYMKASSWAAQQLPDMQK